MHNDTPLTSLASLFLTVLTVFSGHLSLLTSRKFLALILLSVLALSVQLQPQLFGTPFRT